MKKLNSVAIAKAESFVNSHARPLDREFYNFKTGRGDADQVLAELAKYQNEDGGFGNSLEPDFRLQESSAMATSIAFQFFSALGTSAGNECVKRAIGYFVETIDPKLDAWPAVPSAVDSVPRAPWWQHDNWYKSAEDSSGWANPSCEIIGYLHEFTGVAPQKLVDRLTEKALTTIDQPDSAMEMHSFLCWQRLAARLPADPQNRIISRLRNEVPKVVAMDEEGWKGYGLRPHWVASSPDDLLAAELSEPLARCLDFEIDQQGEDGSWSPSWAWGQFEEEWKQAKRDWQGHLTVKMLLTLGNFERL